MRDAYSEPGSQAAVSVARIARQPRGPHRRTDRLSLATDTALATSGDQPARAIGVGGALRRKRAGLDEWAGRITACLNRTVEGIFSTGEELTRAKDALPRGQWEQLFEPNADGVRRVPMSIVTAQRFMAVYRAKDRLLPKASHGTFLPPSWRTLWELQALPEDTLTWALEHGKVRPDMERKHVAALKAEFGGTPPAPSKRGRREYSDLQIRLSELVQREFKQWPDGDATAFQDALLLQVNMFTPLTNRRAEYVETRD